MTFQELHSAKLLTAEFWCVEAPPRSIKGQVVSVHWTPGDSHCSIACRNESGDPLELSGRPVDTRTRDILFQVSSEPARHLCGLLSARGDRVLLRVCQFSQAVPIPKSRPLHLLVDERISSDVPRDQQHRLLCFLREEFLLGDAAVCWGEVTGDISQMSSGFLLLGRERVCQVRFAEDSRFRCERVSRLQRNYDPRRVWLLRGAVDFADARLNTHAPEISKQLRDLRKGAGGYLSTWETYNDLEQYLLVESAPEQAIRYSSLRRGQEQGIPLITLQLADPLPRLYREEDLEIELSEEAAGLTPGPVARLETLSSRCRGREVVARLVDGPQPYLPPRGLFWPSTRGDRARLRRRSEALERVRDGRLPVKTLGLFMEGRNPPAPARRVEIAVTPAVLRRIGRQPTATQQQALQIALNTPDIALIQGPPGTGKTTVIRALVHRLAELHQSQGTFGRILITSYQHDAVDNALERLDPTGIPPYRVGGRRGSEGYSLEIIERWLDTQHRSYQQTLSGLPTSPKRHLAREVDCLLEHWRGSQGGPETVPPLIEAVLEHSESHLDAALVVRLTQLAARFRVLSEPPVSGPPPKGDLELAERLNSLLAGQRLDPQAFADDGPAQAFRLCCFLRQHARELRVDSWAELEALAALQEGDNLPEERLAPLREMVLLLRRGVLEPSIPPAEPTVDPSVDAVLTEVSEALHRAAAGGSDAVAETVAILDQEIQNPAALEVLQQRYSAASAATCQQVMRLSTGREPPLFDVVIVDEAARANPLDLLIPLTLGQRLVLVGDHAQLPHVLEDEVVRRFEDQSGTELPETLRKSLFQRLFDHLRYLDSQGGPRRTALLQDDFRMHPVLSGFVSRVFYEGEVMSRCSTEDRSHGLGLYQDRPACWLHVPRQRGLEQGNQSRFRASEASVVLDEAEQVLRLAPGFTVGLITFYAEQARRLEASQRGERMWPEPWRSRVRTGTVDAFQGREFDVVFLSTVRSNRETEDRRRLGFLTERSRLCVALSRARRLLVVVGDKETVVGSAQRPGIPALGEFHDLCQSPEGFYAER